MVSEKKIRLKKVKIMKTKITLLVLLFVGLNVSFAQQNEECISKLSIFHEYAKAKNYDAAYEPWKAVRTQCPKISIAIYTDGEKILNDKIDKSTGTEKGAYINDLVKLWEERVVNYPAKTDKGEYAAKACQLIYDNKKDLNNTDAELYKCYDDAYQLDKETFTNPKSLYTYFSLM